MSYSITISGHTRNKHNAKVKEIAEEAWAKAKALHDAHEIPPSLSGWSGDQTGSIALETPKEEVQNVDNTEAGRAARESEETETGVEDENEEDEDEDENEDEDSEEKET